MWSIESMYLDRDILRPFGSAGPVYGTSFGAAFKTVWSALGNLIGRQD